MNALTKRFSINTFYLFSLILLSSLFITENVCSKDSWKRSFTQVNYNPVENSISIGFIVFDYHFGPNNVRAYLNSCYFLFTTDGKSYTILMSVETSDQVNGEFTDFQMKLKNIDAHLQLIGCYYPKDRSWWLNNKTDLSVTVKNEIYAQTTISKYDNKYKYNKYNASFTVKWFIGEKFKKVKRIRLYGEWNVIGDKIQPIHNVDYDIPKRKS